MLMQAHSKADLALAAALRGLRHRRGLTQEAVAFKAGVTVSALSRIERGIGEPRWSTICSVAAALHVGLGELEAAIKQMREALQMDPDAHGHATMGVWPT